MPSRLRLLQLSSKALEMRPGKYSLATDIVHGQGQSNSAAAALRCGRAATDTQKTGTSNCYAVTAALR